ncbi:hypothetical protein FGO68_gene17265 [Halteria grandinella]|uniref:Uncharacterized protein n=1 Tax=Halteria grandinella TaxID=5974 RepID=A0A8J8NGC3_HALGN|nr:hypothetical protein FGO68_gene17265 [Halteria grandinella]
MSEFTQEGQYSKVKLIIINYIKDSKKIQMRKHDFFRETLLKNQLANQLVNPEAFSAAINPPPLSKIIITRYDLTELRAKFPTYPPPLEAMEYYFDSVLSLQLARNLEITAPLYLYRSPTNGHEYLFKASDGFQQIDVSLAQIADPKKHSLFSQKLAFDPHCMQQAGSRKLYSSILAVVTQYEFQFVVAPPQDGNADQPPGAPKKQLLLLIKDFTMHSLNDKLPPDLICPPEQHELPSLQHDQEILTYNQYVNYKNLKAKAIRMTLNLPDLRFNPRAEIGESNRGVEPVYSMDEIHAMMLKVKREETSDTMIQVKQEANEQSEQEEEEDELVRTVSEDIDKLNEESDYDQDQQERMQRRIKQMLGIHKNIKQEGEESSSVQKSGRGRWHYASDVRYGFNVSYSHGDFIISMGRVFIIQSPKMSIASKYRGYPIPVIEPPQSEPTSVVPKFRTQYDPYAEDRFLDHQQDTYQQQDLSFPKDQSSDSYQPSSSQKNNTTTTPIDCSILKGKVFTVTTYHAVDEVQRQRGQAIMDSLKYEEEYLSHQKKQQAMAQFKQRQLMGNQMDSSFVGQADYKGDNPFDIMQGTPLQFEVNYDDFSSDPNYFQQYGLDSMKSPLPHHPSTSNNNPPSSFTDLKKTLLCAPDNNSSLSNYDTMNIPHIPGIPNPHRLTAQQKACSFFVNSTYFGNSVALKKGFKIKNTVMKIFKYGTKDFFRFSNATLLEKYDEMEDSVKRLRNEPKVYGNQKRKRMLKYHDRICKLMKHIDKAKIPLKEEQQTPLLEEKKTTQDPFETGFTKQDILKYLSWHRHQQERRYFSTHHQCQLPVVYDVSNFYPVSHNFQLRLQINMNNAPLKSILSNPINRGANNSQPSIQMSSQNSLTKDDDANKKKVLWPETSTIKIIPFDELRKPLPMMVPRPVTSINPSQSRPPSTPGTSLKKRVRLNHDIAEYERSGEDDEEDLMMREFMCKRQIEEDRQQDTQELLQEFDRALGGSKGSEDVFSQEMHLVGGAYNNNNCDFTVQLSENEEEQPAQKQLGFMRQSQLSALSQNSRASQIEGLLKDMKKSDLDRVLYI